MAAAVQSALNEFDSNGGGAAEHGGAMYTQIAVAVLCALNAGSSTKTIARIARRIGKTTAKFHSGNKQRARSRMEEQYCCAISPVVWPVGVCELLAR